MTTGAVRTCRACGCWELRACEGGCAWLTPDRCSACPDAPLTLPVNAAHLDAATFEEAARYHWMSGEAKVERLMLRCIEFPSLMILSTASDGVEIASEIYVGAMRVDAGADTASIASLLNPCQEAA